MSEPRPGRGAARSGHAAVILLVVASVAPPVTDTFTLGVIRRDGIVIPFATYDGGQWRTNWPAPRDHVDVPVDLRSVPARWWGPRGPLQTWQVWTASEPATVGVRQPDWFAAQCQQQIGLRVDYRPNELAPPPDIQPYPKDGLAVSPPRPIERIELLTPGIPPPAVVEAFNAAESTSLAPVRRPGGPVVELSSRQRADIPVKVEAIYAVGRSETSRLYYVEVSRQYVRLSPGDLGRTGCAVLTYGGGWFIQRGGQPLRPLAFHVGVLPCSRIGALYMLPLGVVRVADRMFWIAQQSGWDYEEYDVLEINSRGADPVVRAPGGACRD